jgi:hypothetical protein
MRAEYRRGSWPACVHLGRALGWACRGWCVRVVTADRGTAWGGLRSWTLAPTACAGWDQLAVKLHSGVEACGRAHQSCLCCLYSKRPMMSMAGVQSRAHEVPKAPSIASEGIWLHLSAPCLCEPAHISGATICGRSAAARSSLPTFGQLQCGRYTRTQQRVHVDRALRLSSPRPASSKAS